MKETYYSNGKLLLTGEYLVLDGAKALALPTKMGQTLEVSANEVPSIFWQSFDADGSKWFEEELHLKDILGYQPSKEPSIKDTLLKILHHAQVLQPNAFRDQKGFEVQTTLTFPKNWGLGTSSTLINNIAQWLNIDAFQLLRNSFGGSGYDIACAQHNTPILYQLDQNSPIVTPLSFEPTFAAQLYFVYLNQKQNSATAIASYFNTKHKNLKANVQTITKLTQKISQAEEIGTFAKALQEHESLMSAILELSTIQEKLFPDFEGVIKSLGAWGGDFVLAIAKENPTPYFTAKGFTTVIPYNDMIL